MSLDRLREERRKIFLGWAGFCGYFYLSFLEERECSTRVGVGVEVGDGLHSKCKCI